MPRGALSFDERFALLVDAEWGARENKRLTRALQDATLKVPHACIEAIDDPGRPELDRALSGSSRVAAGWPSTSRSSFLAAGQKDRNGMGAADHLGADLKEAFDQLHRLDVRQGAQDGKHYEDLLGKTDFLVYFKNSVLVTVPVVFFSIVISVLAAYALSRLGFVGASVIGTSLFLVYLVPDSLLFIPLFKVVGQLGLLNSKWSLLLVYPTLIVPFATWLLIGYFASIPRELDEVALVDGANYLQMLVRIFLPVAVPGLIAATIFAFTVSWSGFLYPLAFIFSSKEQVLTAGIVTSLIKGDVYHWGELMVGALLACLPPVLLYAFLMDYYISGLTAGSTKA